MPNEQMMVFSVPDDPELLKELGRVAVLHTHLDMALKMMIKSLAGLSVREGRDALRWTTAGTLRNRIRRLATQRLGEGKALLKLEAMLQRCEELSRKRNEYVHRVVAEVLDSGNPQLETRDYGWTSLPTITEVQALATQIDALTREMHHERLSGFLFEALERTEKR